MNFKLSIVALVGVVAALGTLPHANASVSQTTPAGAVCLMTDNDGCTTTWSTGVAGQYLLSLNGAFEGTVSITAASHANPNIAYTLTCSGTLTGALMTAGGCTQGGFFPSGAIDLTCSSSGTGVVGCEIAGQ